jgi:hypothetical protein
VLSQIVPALFLVAEPTTAQIDAIEVVTARDPCIGNLDGWQRNYLFKFKEWRGVTAVVDTKRVYFNYRQAGPGARAGRTVNQISSLDHRQFRTASGWYDIASGQVAIRSCGWNCGEDVPPDGSCG